MREGGDILEFGAKQARRGPAGKGENPTRLRRLGGIENIGVEAEHEAGNGFPSIVDRKQKGIGPGLHLEGIGCVIVGDNVVHSLVKKKGVEQQVQQLDELRAVRGVANKVRLDRDDASVRQLHLDVPRYVDGDAVDDIRVQYGVPVFSLGGEELRALNRVAKLNVVAGGVVCPSEVRRIR